MMRVFMFTAYELINCVTLRATRSAFTVSGNKLKTIPHSILGFFGGVLHCETQSEETS